MNRAATALPWIWATSGILGTLHTYYFTGSQLGFSLANLSGVITRDQGAGLLAGIVVGLTYAVILKPRENRRRITLLGYLHLACIVGAFVASFVHGLNALHNSDYAWSAMAERGSARWFIRQASIYLTPIGFVFYIAALVTALRTKTSATEVF
ncbi:hypothetical protein [Hyphomonas sp.]|uniref:hypothetical protein n=1 Tax=Hyphomonas sp. TaxID=87 RepID=UPI003526CE9B